MTFGFALGGRVACVVTTQCSSVDIHQVYGLFSNHEFTETNAGADQLGALPNIGKASQRLPLKTPVGASLSGFSFLWPLMGGL